ncbi:MAG TPA: alpha/beta fold hydrolase [Steroidobacteraceae bacterium]|nr:alpha/beta fold hydrolase [Steroidobacteraceae bacterium]
MRLLDSLHVKQVDVVGHSFGGAIAAQFAADYPTKVRRMVFIAAAVYPPKSPALEALIQMPAGVGRGLAWSLFGDGPLSIVHRLCIRLATEDCKKTLRIHGSIDTVRAMMYTSRHTPDIDLLPAALARIRAPSLAIWGSADAIIPVADGQRLASKVNARIEIIRGAQHMPYLGHPDEVKELILRFLDRE